MTGRSGKVKEGRSQRKRHKGIVLAVLFALIVFIVVVMAWNSRKPDYHTLHNVDRGVKGAHFVKINQVLVKDMVDNWLPNDLFWPTVFLDNMPKTSSFLSTIIIWG